ncbi:leucine-rich repeat protein [Winogradskyella sp. A2]|uniref:leucine-rich repeat protein n=1 Tax=Winogradskyella sp. A2 TaxID=3366944 RepID=UPI00398C5DAE
MKTKIYLIILALFSWCTAFAQIFEVDGINYFITAPDKVRVHVKTGCYSGDIVIPESVEYSDDNYAVTAIGVNAFKGCLSLNSVALPSSIEEIQSQAFLEAENLTAVNFPSSISNIGNYAFMRCYALETIDLSATSVTTLGDYAFTRCESATSIVLPNTMTSIGDFNFYYCGSLTQIDIPNTATSLGIRAFSYSGLTSIDIPDSVTTIGLSAFEVCADLETINVPNSITSIGDNVFYGNYSLTSFNIGVSVPLIINSNVFAGTPINNAILNVPAGSESNYATAPVWQNFGTINGTLSTNEQNIANSVMIYPNPSSEFLSIRGIKEQEFYVIYNLEGKMVSKGIISNNLKVNIQRLKNGVYFLKLNDYDAIKFIKGI